jgi:predicted ester cyclase
MRAAASGLPGSPAASKFFEPRKEFTMTAETNKTVVRRFFERQDAGDFSGVESILDSRILIHQPGSPNLDLKGYRKLSEDYRQGFPDTHTTIDDLIAEGDYVVARITYRGTHRGTLMGIAPTNRQIVLPSVVICRLSNGRVAELWEEFDQLSLMTQLGVIKMPLTPGR